MNYAPGPFAEMAQAQDAAVVDDAAARWWYVRSSRRKKNSRYTLGGDRDPMVVVVGPVYILRAAGWGRRMIDVSHKNFSSNTKEEYPPACLWPDPGEKKD